MLRRFIRGEEGAALVEYGLLVGLIAVVCILVITALGDGVHDMFDVTNTAVQGAEDSAVNNPPTTPAD